MSLESLTTFLNAYGYWFFFGVGFAEFVGAPLAPSAVLVAVGGLVAGHELSLPLIVGAKFLPGTARRTGRWGWTNPPPAGPRRPERRTDRRPLVSSISPFFFPFSFLALAVAFLPACGGDGGGGTGPVTGTVRGTVTADGVGLEVTVSLSGPVSRTATSTASGNYSFSGLEGGSYTIAISEIPSDADFQQTEKTATVVSGGETVTVDFQGTLIRGTLQGTVTTDVGPAEGITVRAAGTETVEGETDETGSFRLEVRAGSYTVSLTELDPLHYEFPETEKEVEVAREEASTVSFQGTDLWGPCALGRLSATARASGALEEGDCTTESGSLRDVYVYYGSEGETLEIGVESTAFDAFLLLRGTDGEELATDGDEGEGRNAHLSHTFQASGRHWIEVSSVEAGGSGGYTLELAGEAGAGGVWGSAAVGWWHSCGITSDGAGHCWGRNRAGQLGNGQPSQPPRDGIFSTQPVLVSGETTFTRIAAGASTTCAVDTDDAAFCWGSNLRGELGTGSAETGNFEPTPRAVTGGHAFSDVSVGADHACGLTTGGDILCWGGDADGQLGTRSGRSATPLAVESDREFSALSAGWFYTCALDVGGVALCWGANSSGELGTNDTENELTPTPVTGGMRFSEIAAGFAHTCGITEEGRAFCWGDNGVGQLGIGSAADGQIVTSATRVETGLRFASVAVGGSHTCALTPAGAAWCWGSGARGQLGREELGGEIAVEPSRVVGGLTFRSIHAGLSHTCGVTTGGDMYCWGGNAEESSGALGIGSTGNEPTPRRVVNP